MQVVLKRKNVTELELAKALSGVIRTEGITDQVIDHLRKSDEHDEPIPEKYIRYIARKMIDEYGSLMTTLYRNIDKWFSALSRKGKSFLWKSENEPPPVLSQEQIDELKMLIQFHFRHAIGVSYKVPNDMQKSWNRIGIQKPNSDLETWINQAYVAGRLAEVLNNNSSYRKMVEEAEKLPISRMDRLVLNAAKQNAAKYIGQYAEKLANTADELVLSNNKASVHDIVQGYFSGDLTQTTYNGAGFSPNEVKHLLSTEKEVKGWRELATELKNRFKLADMNRDWDRIAISEIRYATNLGRVTNIQIEGGGNPHEIEVYYHVQPTACKYCKELYLEEDGTPKVFKLAEIIDNIQQTGGMQIGLKPSLIGKPGGWVANAVCHPRGHCYPVRKIPGYKLIPVGKVDEI